MMDKQNQEIEICDISQQQQSKDNIQYECILKQENIQFLSKVKLRQLQVLSQLGKGTFGQVYKVIYYNKIYALKQILKQQIINDFKYAQNEIQVLKKINHVNIIKLYHSFQTQNYLYMIMDYCENGDLTNFMTHGTILDEQTSIFIIAQIILAIDYLHKFDVIYRDLKPENIVINSNYYIKLIDFGLSKQYVNIAHSFCGSPAYLSPELLNGQGVTQNTDIYCIGLILYEMLNGYPPFYSENIRILLNNIQNQELKFPKTISSPMQHLLIKMLNRNPIQRITINEIKQHVIFSQINWNKLENQEYKAPQLIRRKQIKEQQISKFIDFDYNDEQEKQNFIQNWDYSL